VANVSADATEGLLLSPDGLALYAVAQGDTSVSVISTASNEVSSVTAYPGTGTANSATTSPDGKTLYVSTSLGLLEISTASSAITGDVSLPGLGHQIAASADGQYVYACLLNEYSLSQHRTNTAPGLQQISLGSGTVTSVPVAGAVIALQIPAPDSPLYLLEDPYSIATEDTVTGAASSKPGVATGVSVLSVSGSGNLVAGVSQIAKQPGYPVGAVSLVDTATHSLVGQFSYGSGALNSAPATSIALNSAGTVGYMSILSPKAERPVISAFSLPSGEVQSSLLLGTEYNGYNPLLVATAPDDSALYLALVDDTINICKIALPKLALIICASANFGTYVNSLIVDPSGTALYLPYAVFGQPLQYFLQELDSATLQQVRQVQIKGPSPASSPLPVASAYSAATNSVYLANSGPTAVAGSIARVDLASFTVAETQYLGYVPQGLAATPDGTELLVTGSLNGTQIFDGTTLAPIGSIAGGLQQAIVIAPQ
jgi:DNA-binding beta-propeller fold protein YncE